MNATPWRSKKAGKVRRHVQIMPTLTSRTLGPWMRMIEGLGGYSKEDSRPNLYLSNIPCAVSIGIKYGSLCKSDDTSNDGTKPINPRGRLSNSGSTYNIPRLKTAMSLNLCRNFMLRAQIAGVGRRSTQISLATLIAPEVYGRPFGFKQCPCFISGFQLFSIGIHWNRLAKNKPV